MATGETEGLVQRRRQSQTLKPLLIPGRGSSLSTDGLGQADDDIEEEGRELFKHFVYDAIVGEGLECDLSLRDLLSRISTPGYKNASWTKAGRELRFMADEFAKTKEREIIKRLAEEIEIQSVAYEQFRDLLSELFNAGGFTKERLMSIFFFCSDIVISTLRRDVKLFNQFLEWSFQFITENVCTSIRLNGGWGDVLRHPVPFPGMITIAFGALAFMFVLAARTFIHR